MSAEQLITKHLDIWTSAHKTRSSAGRGSSNKLDLYGIKKLRELILELAVRGKLVPQDPNDEPASELLKRIASEKAKLIKEGKIRKEKNLINISLDDIPFDIPKNWEIVKLGIVSTKLTDGSHNPPVDAGSGFPMLSSQNVNFGRIDFSNPSRFVTSEDFEKENSRTLIEFDDVLLTIVGTIGRSAVVPQNAPKFVLQRSVAVIKTGLYPKFLANQFESLTSSKYFELHGKGTAQKGIYLGKLADMPLLIPPLKEQYRIVAKVDELMAFCDELEQAQTDNIAAHAQLVEALLTTLTNSKNHQELQANWQRIAEHFDTLFTTEDSIDQLKQTILQLAVMGKLVPQDPNDEPASELLKKIAAEKAQLIKEGKIKKEKPLSELSDEERPFVLPNGWEWEKLGMITTGMDSGWSPACLANNSRSDEIWGVLKTTAVQVMEYQEFENKELPSSLKPRHDAEVKTGDILFTRAGPMNRVGISCLVERTRPRLMISDKIIRFHPVEIGIDGRFLTLCLNTGATAIYLENSKSGMASSQVNITQENLRSAPIPVAPLNEQHRIITKVDEIISLCNKLKYAIRKFQEEKLELVDALIES